jgi:sulfite exporter TauE/SafE
VIELLPVVLGSSLLGSVHCVAMCGPLVGLHGGARSLWLAASHSLGRLATYAAIGAAAGLVGAAVDVAGALVTVQRAATVMAAAALVAIAVKSARPRARAAHASGTAFRAGLVRIRTRRPAARAWLLGAVTGLLPCGWLWAFAITAAGTASPLAGAGVMTAFWLGTVPAMLGVLAVFGPAIARLRTRLPLVTATVLAVVGLATLAMRWRDAGAAQVEHPHCHCHDGTGHD